MSRVYLVICMVVVIWLVSCDNRGNSVGFSTDEKEVIGQLREGIMPLKVITVKEDSLFLRCQALPLGIGELKSEEFNILQERMLLTVNDTTNPGVGIAAPQVGVSRRMIAVQRFDLPGEPFGIYVNPVITYYSDSLVLGREGCLSVPDIEGMVRRSFEITLRYNDPEDYLSEMGGGLKVKTETIRGFTAVIFQHEVDHLNGILFMDKMVGSSPKTEE